MLDRSLRLARYKIRMNWAWIQIEFVVGNGSCHLACRESVYGPEKNGKRWNCLTDVDLMAREKNFQERR
jgi:hypothetical protein